MLLSNLGLRDGPWPGLGLALVLFGLFAACERVPEPEAGRSVDGEPVTIRIGIHSDILSFDPHRYDELLTYAVLRNLYEPLITFDSQLRIEPCLAESWENPDELTWRFYLRSGVRFHDGGELTAADVVFALERARKHPESALASYLVQVEEVVAVDRSTVEIRTTRPYPILLNKLAYLPILPAGISEEMEASIGTGAYRLVRWRPGESIELEAFEDYWRGRPPVERVRFRPVRDPEERVETLLAGGLDIVREVAPWLADRVEASRAVRLERRLGLEVQYLHLRPDWGPFRDPRVRRAVHVALDRSALVEEIQHGHGRPVGQLVSANVFGFAPSVQAPEPDPETARRLLAEAGYPEGFSAPLVTREGRHPEPIVEQLAEIGIEVEVSVEPWTELYPRFDQEKIPFYYGAAVASTADASDILDSKVHTREPERGYGSTNFGGYSDPRVDALIEESGSTLEMIPRRELLQEAMERTMEDLVYVPLFVTYDLYGIRQEIEWRPRLDTVLLVREMRRRTGAGALER